ncbi:MAG: TatD family hydrolase [Planctomycetes bacterium]|nr:TatD family hydrolase [Planctomycetota bacterium]
MQVVSARISITDTHAHLFWASFDADREEVIARARERGVERFVVVGTDVATSKAAFELCAGRAGFFPTAGIHPHDATASDAAARAEIRELCSRTECVAVGETGLDWFKEYSPRAEQLENFHWHAALARELDKPLVVHSRDAHVDTVEVLRSAGGVRGVMHCYSMGPDELAPYLELGFYISFSGMVTYPKNTANRAAAEQVPLDRIVFETDCPYLAPQKKRGTRNEPGNVRDVLEAVAGWRGLDVQELARVSSANAGRLFRLTE